MTPLGARGGLDAEAEDNPEKTNERRMNFSRKHHPSLLNFHVGYVVSLDTCSRMDNIPKIEQNRKAFLQ